MNNDQILQEIKDITYEIDNQLKRRKRWIIALSILSILLFSVAVLEFFVIQDMAYDLRNEISINHDLEKIASFCMQSNYANTGDTQ